MVRELYRLRVAADPGREALRFSDHAISHGELLGLIGHWQERVEAAVERCAPAPDGVWAIHGDDTVDNLLLGLSQFFAGRPLLLLPLHATEEERAALILRTGVAAVLTDRPLPQAFAMEPGTEVGEGWELWTPGPRSDRGAAEGPAILDTPAVTAGVGHAASEALALLDRPAGLALTSGTTTGVPAIQRSPYFESLAVLQRSEWPPSRRMLFTFRMQFGASRSWATRILLEGATLCCVRVSERSDLPELAGQMEADTLPVNPPYMEQMLAERLDQRFPASLAFVTGTDRVPAGLRRRFHERFGARLTIALANSRLGPLTMLPPDRLLAHDGETVGFPLPSVQFRFDPDAAQKWHDQGIGEAVVAKTWRVHLEHPQHGRIALERTVEDARPGDLLRRWPDGLLSFAGRANDVFLFRSVLVSPHEIEDLLAEDAAIEEVVAFGAPSSVYGAVPMAALRLRPERVAADELPRLRRLCQDAMGYRAPKALIPMEEIPRGPSGKPLRRELARLHALT
jgi:acyl-CoA synthetase (AMP-forming)/AMP-acid ligase II